MGTGWILLIAVLAAAAAAAAWITYGRNRDVVTKVEVLPLAADDGATAPAARALMVYHPGRSDFQRRVFRGFAEGLVSNGWRVDVTTASARAPTDLSGYDLLVIGGPTYWFSPNRPIRRYLSRLGDLRGKRTVTIITALGAGERSSAIVQGLVREANGDLVKALLLFKMRPNDDDNPVGGEENQALAVEMARQAAQEIAPPEEDAGA